MKILILGMDGYIGWSLALRLLGLGNEVCGIDNFSRRKNVEEMGSWSAIPILSMQKRIEILRKEFGDKVCFYEGNLTDQKFTDDVIKNTKPDAIVHLAEQPSAPYSMIDQNHALYTQSNNVIGTLNVLYSIKNHAPKTHLIKLGTMGEYGYGNDIDITEGFMEIEFRGKKTVIPYPRMAGSWYHWSKVHDSNNIMFACKLWNLTSTDIMQGIVYGTRTTEMRADNKMTRFDFDEVFGTVINRYCSQAVIGHPLTVYGKGGQTRGFLALEDSIQCITILINKPPEQGEYRVVNQFDEQYRVSELANRVKRIGDKKGLNVEVQNVDNPRLEKEEHYYKADHEHLKKLGFKPTRHIDDEIGIMLDDLVIFKERIVEKKESIVKVVRWNDGAKQSMENAAISYKN
ncbi:MAG TPA: UDP-sulfoquinovose synthase [Candidatus Nitrosotalea sp.]|nr:UDP-sulfoquinovose synthase [Candidatus Nitrosotalea sp.]